MKRFWTVKEEAVLREHYSRPGGVAVCVSLLPGRSVGAIMQHGGHVLQLRAHKSPLERKRWTTTEHIDQAIRFVYQNNPQRSAINDLARRIARPRWWVSKRSAALALAVPRYRDKPWSDRETEILEQWSFRSLKAIHRALKAEGFARTETAIAVKRKRLHLDVRDPNQYSARQVARLMGVDGGTVCHWIKNFGLPARRRGTNRTAQQGGDEYVITRKALRWWIAENAARVDLRKVDRFWFIDLLIANREQAKAA